MFTGLVQLQAEVKGMVPAAPGMRLEISTLSVLALQAREQETAPAGLGAKDNLPQEKSSLFQDVVLGDSIAINGCCLTVVQADHHTLAFDAGPETLQCTNLGELTVGSQVNLEKSLSLGDSLGGHLVTGHVDGVGHVEECLREGDWTTLWFSAPESLLRQMASKGSIAVDGVSLTLVKVEDSRFSVALIPHTLQVTTLGSRKLGDRVNLETDVLAKYVERQLQWK